MFILDTNILSAIMAARPVPEVATWIARQPEELLFTAAVCQAEILSGIAILPASRRRTALETAARLMFREDFEGRVLPFNAEAAEAYADIFAARRAAGLSTPPTDLMIAAVARAKGAGVVTRDIGGFTGCGLTVINPWETL
jgi:predicted nucleic acid-binding protein